MSTNEEYLDRWDNSGLEAVETKMTPEEIARSQGTRNQDKNPWETYGTEMESESPEMLAAIEEYAKNVSDAEGTSETKEELARLREGNANTAREYQFVEPDEYNNVEERTGKVLHASSFIRKLQEAGINCWYRQHPQPGKITLMVQRKNHPPEVGCWCQDGFTTELSIMRFDEQGVPTTEKFRGWRTPLLQLILKNIITEKKANEIFGPPKTTPAFDRYNQTLQSYRNVGSSLGEAK